ncbi:MAG: hypothetical protein ABJH68_09890 [Ilumatobacter sp.]|uniref:hypothetical protein n=1 Tax=Ilumatobacter sp. TaxID=1967498 RepID=UPI003297A4FD
MTHDHAEARIHTADGWRSGTHDLQAERGRFGRRTFIIGTAAAGVLAACSNDGSSNGGDGSSGDGTAVGDGDSASDGDFSLVQRFATDSPILVPGELRLPFGLMRNAEFIVDGPDTLSARIVDIDGNTIGEPISATRRDVTPAPYYAFRAPVDRPGIYGIIVDGGPSTAANFQVFDPADVTIPIPGETLAGFDTPTVEEPAGVDPICTRQPSCEFHSVTLTEALATGSPVAYFVGTPAFCATESCTPALEALIELQPEFSDVVFVHAEVYTDDTASVSTPAVQALGLFFEPTVFLVGPDGVIMDRVDNLWNPDEMRERLRALTV